MAGKNQVPERLINSRVYNDGNDLMGLANVELPEIAALVEEVAGIGISGKVESPTLGHFEAMSTKLSWNTITEKGLELCKQKSHSIEVRGSQQVYDAASGNYETVAVRVSMKVAPKTTTLGTFEPGATTGTEQEFSVTYLKVVVGGKTMVEIDPFNFVAKFGNEDALAQVRKDLGLN